ncbi:MAG: tRNA pseudouridine(38-40) synthase TruA [Planctomyces sp.]|nr:tRNA pseudouridine(38-40) synthase TruA [Planctomyces sp.]
MLTLSYQGTGYCGWQIQPNGLSVQACVEQAVEKLTGAHSHVLCAGRTDSGVHAIGQVANFRTSVNIPINRMRRALQSHLPEDIVIIAAKEVHSTFHATYSAVSKRYRYVIFDGVVCPPFLRPLVHRVFEPLDVSAMNEATRSLLGTHDFRCFETHYPNKSTSVRTILECSVRRTAGWAPWVSGHRWNDPADHPLDRRSAEQISGPFIVLDIKADGFLYNMVRAIAGTLIRIGRGQRPVEDMERVIQSLDRREGGMTAPAEGLYLIEVDYPAELLK